MLSEVIAFTIGKFEDKVQKGLRSEQSLSKWRTIKTKITQFLKFAYQIDDIQLSKINYAFAGDFVDYLVTKQAVNTNTSYKYFKHLKQLLKVAVDRGWLAVNPFQGFHSKYIVPERDILNFQELMLLYSKTFSIARIEEVKDAFLFMCFTGYSFRDAQALTPQNVMEYFDGEEWIIKNRDKTLCRENVPLLPIVKEIIAKYQNNPFCVNNNRILPIKSNQKFNLYLKEIAGICNIQKVLTSHVARHTFATTVTLANGVPIETVSALLGHKSIKTTQIYANIVAEKVGKDMLALKERLELKMPKSLTRMPTNTERKDKTSS
ncbi:Site-specific recombinase XerD [Chitinophaga rupis]|uniref:Site-specific recombinase XerD n=2 Tax=Chitinophaga rupis TaxID=573321 RepID=A0A1H7VZM8_9BACT|nr:Site-specific recombinase XerD [Chitinophaga rupis]